MIVPTRILPVTPSIPNEEHKIVNYCIHDGILLERVEASGQTAYVFRGTSDLILRRYQTDFKIINTLFVTFTPKTPQSYLCLVGETQIDFYALTDNDFCSLALPFKICQAHLCSFGLILERDCFTGAPNSIPDGAQLFSLTHPYNEMFPILCKMKESICCQYAFRNKRIRLVNKEPSVDQFVRSAELIMAYDIQERTNHIYAIRKCTKEERLAAKNTLQSFSSTINTPNSLQSYYSPNFFIRRFGQEDRHFPQPQNSLVIRDSSFNQTNVTGSHSHSGSSFPSTGSFPRTLTPVRRTIYTRSMAAAVHSENLAFANSLGTSISFSSCDKSMIHKPSYKHIYERKNHQARALSGPDGLFHSTPTKPNFDDELLSFGGYGDEPANPLDISVEFCLEWLWGESLSGNGDSDDIQMEEDPSTDTQLPNVVQSQEATAANKLDHLKVSCQLPTFGISDSTCYRLPTSFFVTEDKLGQRFVVFHVSSDKKIRVLRIHGLPDSPAISEPCPIIPAFSCSTFLGAPYFAVLERTNLSQDDNDCAPPSPSGPSISLYTGSSKIGNVALNFSSVFDCSQLITALRTFVRILPSGSNSFYLEYTESGQAGRNYLRCEFQLTPNTSLASRCLNILCESLPKEKQIQFYARYITTNPWRIVDSVFRNLCCQEMHIADLEISLIFEHFLIETGLDPSNLPFINNIIITRKNQLNIVNDEVLQKKAKSMPIENNEKKENQKICSLWDEFCSSNLLEELPTFLHDSIQIVKPYRKLTISIKSNARLPDLNEKAIFSGFTALHNFYESLKLEKVFLTILRTVAEPLFAFATVYQLERFIEHYKKDFPELNQFFDDRDSFEIRDNSKFSQKFRVTGLLQTLDGLTTSFTLPGYVSSVLPHFYQLSDDFCPTRIFTCLGIALGRLRTSAHLHRFLGKNWFKRLHFSEVDETLKQKLLNLLADESLTAEKRCSRCMDFLDVPIQRLEFLNEKFFDVFKAVLESEVHRQANSLLASKLRVFPTPEAFDRWTSLRWNSDIRLYNVLQMLDSSLPVLIPVSHKPTTILTDAQQREQQESFLLLTATKTITRPFGQALLNFRTKRPEPNKSTTVQQICLNGRVNPGRIQVDYPTNDANTTHKAAMEWANFYNGVAHGLAILGFGSTIGIGSRRNKATDKGFVNRTAPINFSQETSSTTVLGLTIGGSCNTTTTSLSSPLSSPPKQIKEWNKGKPLHYARSQELSVYEKLYGKSFTTLNTHGVLSTKVVKNGAIVPYQVRRRRNIRQRAKLPISNQPLFGTFFCSSMRQYSNHQRPLSFTTFNGSAFSKTIPLANPVSCSKVESVLNWEWLSRNVLKAYDKHPSTQAGLFFAAGLTGHIRSINLYDVHSFITKNDRFLVMALLMGCAVAYRGTADVHVYKVLTTHLPFLLQPTLCELRIESSVQTAAVISLGILFMETSNLSLVDQLVNQMSLELFEGDQCSERYSFVLASGFAVGLINLGKGRAIDDSEIPLEKTHLSLKERLIKLLNGGERKFTYVSYDRIRCPGIKVSTSAQSTFGINQTSKRYGPGASVANQINPDEDPQPFDVIYNVNTIDPAHITSGSVGRGWTSTMGIDTCPVDPSGIGAPLSNHVRERPNVNVHMTSPAACAALGLMYLRTGDQWVIETLAIPDSFYVIEKIRPDLLMMRTLCRCLVDFGKIGSSADWVLSQVPEIVKKYVNRFLNSVRFSPSRNSPTDPNFWVNFIDMHTVSQAFYYCAAGACLAMCFRYASTCDNSVFRTISWFYETIQENNTSNIYLRLTEKAGRNCLNSCTNIVSICFGMLMAGSGDLQTLRILRKIRNLKSRAASPSKDLSVHSLHVSVNMAIGLLFLGHARLALSRSNASIASLLIAFFPLFPHSISDNRVYFQPLRFLWALALEPRFLVTVDSQTLEAVCTNCKIVFKDSSKDDTIGTTPILLPPINMIESIHIATIVQDPLASPSKDVGQQDYQKNENSLNDTPSIDISINDDCSSEVSWSSCDEEKLKKCEKPPPPRYNPVNLHLSNENDLRRLKKCLCHFFGRLPIKKI